jgi:glycosyltransferase involved in cell wall biosynthesis
LFVPPNDELAFARAIAVLMDDPELRQKLGRFGRARVERDLQWSVTGQNLLTAYERLFPETKRHSPLSRPGEAAVSRGIELP